MSATEVCSVGCVAAAMQHQQQQEVTTDLIIIVIIRIVVRIIIVGDVNKVRLQLMCEICRSGA